MSELYSTLDAAAPVRRKRSDSSTNCLPSYPCAESPGAYCTTSLPFINAKCPGNEQKNA